MGFIIGIFNAFAAALQNTQLRVLGNVDIIILNWLRFLIGTAVLAVLVTIFSDWHLPPRQIWLLLFGISLPLEVALASSYAHAFQISPQSLVGPLFGLTTIFIIPVSFLLNHELPSILGLVGVVIGFLGALVLGWDFAHGSVKGALKNIFKEKGSYFMIGAALLATVVVSVAKFSYQYISPLLFAFYITLLLFIVHTPFIFFKSFAQLKGRVKQAAIMALAYGAGISFHYVGLSLLIAAYYISVKRLSMVFDVIFGRLFGKEDHVYERMTGAVLMVIGITLIAFS